MRMPIKSEADAFRIAFGSAALIALSIALGALVTPLAGVALLVGGVLGALFVELRLGELDRVQPLRPASHEPPLTSPARSARRRLLAIEKQTVGGEELKGEILARVKLDELRPGPRIVVPALCSRSHYLTHIPERSHWLEAGVVERARNELDIPATHVMVDLARQPSAVKA